MIRRGYLLHRMFGHHPETASHLVGIHRRERAVQRNAVSGHAASHDGRMRGKDRGDERRELAQIQPARSRHPLVEMRGHAVGEVAEIVGIALYHLSGSITEQNRFYVIPLSANRVHAVGIPEKLQDFVLLSEKRTEIHQHRKRRTLDPPTAHLYADAFVIEGLAPEFESLRILLEFSVGILAMHVGSYDHIFVSQHLPHGKSLGRQHGMYAAHLVANLPAHFEQKVRYHLFCFLLVHLFPNYFLRLYFSYLLLCESFGLQI